MFGPREPITSSLIVTRNARRSVDCRVFAFVDAVSRGNHRENEEWRCWRMCDLRGVQDAAKRGARRSL